MLALVGLSTSCSKAKNLESQRSDDPLDGLVTGPEPVSPTPEPSTTDPVSPGPSPSDKPQAPTISDVSSDTADGIYTAGAKIIFHVRFSTEVTVVGVPALALVCGSDKQALYQSATNGKDLSFAYEVAVGDNCEKLAVALDKPLSAAGGSIQDSALTAADLTLPKTPSFATTNVIAVDTSSPGIPESFLASAKDGSVTLSWTAVAGASGYLLRRTPAVAGSWQPERGASYVESALTDGSLILSVMDALTFVDSSPINAKISHYFVYAFDTAHNYSSGATAEVLSLPMLWVPDGTVSTLAVSGTKLFVGGTFQSFGPYTGGAASVDASGASLTAAVRPRVHGAVRAIAALADGGWLLGGDFTQVGDAARQHLARFDAEGELTAWAPALNGKVRAVLVQGGKVYVGGDFTTAAGQSRSRLAAFDLTSGELTAYAPVVDGPVHALATDGTKIYLGGIFANVDGTARLHLAATNFSGQLDATFNPGADAIVRSLCVAGGSLFAGGSFTTIGGQNRPNLALLSSSDGTAQTAFDAQVDLPVWALASDGSRLFLGGDFSSAGGASRSYVAAVSLSDGTAQAFNPGANGSVLALAVRNGLVYAGGNFQNFGSAVRSRIAAVKISDASLDAFSPKADGDVLAVAAGASGLFLGGSFQSLGERVQTANLAAIDLETGAPATGWSGTTDGTVRALAIRGTKLYVGGDFANAGGASHVRLAAFQLADGVVDSSWNPAADGSVQTLALADDRLHVGGSFTQINATSRNRLALLEADGTLASWDFPANTTVKTLAVSPDFVFAGGQFSSFGLLARNRLAAVTRAATPAVSTLVHPLVNGTVEALASVGTTLYFGGSFDQVAGSPRSGLAAVNILDGQVDPLFAPLIDDAAFNDVNFILPGGPDLLFVGGSFTIVGSASHSGLVGLDAATGTVTSGPWDDIVGSGTANAGVTYLGHLFIGGGYSSQGRGFPGRLAATRLPAAD